MPQSRFVNFRRVLVRPINRDDYRTILAIEKKVYRKKELQGPSLIEHIRRKNGLEYSWVAVGLTKNKKQEIIGYLVAIDDKMADGKRTCVYLDDIALIPRAQRQGIGWKLIKSLVLHLHEKATNQREPILFDMHLMPSSQRFMDKHAAKLVKLGAQVCEEEQYLGYYEKNQPALYRVYLVK